MAKLELRNGKIIGDFLKPYIVAEMNTSHFGNIEAAQEMILKAKEVGCDCVKFQSWTSETLYSKAFYKDNPIAERMVAKFSLSEPQLYSLSHFAKDVGIDFSSTPYSLEEAKFLIHECNVPFIKVASMELNNLPFLSKLAKLSVPLVLSTGMGNMDEIKNAVLTIENSGINPSLAILHCTSIYPAEPAEIRLQNIIGLRNEFNNNPIGYSDHSEGSELACASVALGSCLIEKHFTTDKSKIGMDNQMATEPKDMAKMINQCHRVYAALGSEERIISEAEKTMSLKMRRSMIAKCNIRSGEKLVEQKIDFKRPGDGISPSEYKRFIGKKIKNNISEGNKITLDDFETE